MKHGKLVISLDLELMWGVRDVQSLSAYGNNILGVQQVLPRLLQLFKKYKVDATFATVGLLFFENKAEMLQNLPVTFPPYHNKKLTPYAGYFDTVGNSAEDDPYHYGLNLIRQILEYPGHEISSHTFSHYYCLEDGQTIENFRDDLQAALKISARYSLRPTSLVFPRNQYNDAYLDVCKSLGIICIRGNENSWLYSARAGAKENQVRRALRLVDAFVNITGHHCYSDDYLNRPIPLNIPASRFLRPWSPKLPFLDGLKFKRIQSGMNHAAKNGFTYHLWWHPHNFGINQEENFHFLEQILSSYHELHQRYQYTSYTMTALAETFLKKRHSNEHTADKRFSD